MQRRLAGKKLSEEEEIKSAGLILDFDEIAKRGSMSKEEGFIAKWYGMYGSRHPGNLMARIVIPGGVISTAQARKIAKTAEHFAQGRLNLTTRQAIQYHWLKVPRLPDMLRELSEENLTTFHGCGDVNRNPAACSMAENCVHARINVRPYAKETARFLGSCRDLDNLPRKFKITWSGCTGDCAQPWMNCVGMIAVTVDIDGKRSTGFRVVIGGGMGWKPFVAQELFSFVPADRGVLLTRAIALLYRDYGNRFNRAKSRLKFVVEKLGIERCRELVIDYLHQEGVSTEGFYFGSLKDVLSEVPCRPLTDNKFKTKDGTSVLRVLIPKGEMNSKQLLMLANISDSYADQKIYTTNRQNIELHGISPQRLSSALKAVCDMGYETDGIEGIKDIVACVGTTYCPKAVAETRKLHNLLDGLVRESVFEAISEAVRINITGCPNSCSPYRIADIGFRGLRLRRTQGSVEGFEMLIGGDQKNHGQKLGDFTTEDCVEVTRCVLKTFLSLRTEAETLTACVLRVGMEQFRKAVFSEV